MDTIDPHHRIDLGMAPLSDDKDMVVRRVFPDQSKVAGHHRAGGVYQGISRGKEFPPFLVGHAMGTDNQHAPFPLGGSIDGDKAAPLELVSHNPVVDQLAEAIDRTVVDGPQLFVRQFQSALYPTAILKHRRKDDLHAPILPEISGKNHWR